MKTTKIILTEGQMDEEVLKTILPDEITSNIKIIQSGGYSSALSIARTLLLNDNYQLAIVLDADTTDNSAIYQKKAFIKSYLGSNNDGKYKIFLFSPSIESLLTADRETLESVIGKKMTNNEWERATNSPKTYLLDKNLKSNKAFFKKSKFKKNSLVKELVEYLIAA